MKGSCSRSFAQFVYFWLNETGEAIKEWRSRDLQNGSVFDETLVFIESVPTAQEKYVLVDTDTSQVDPTDFQVANRPLFLTNESQKS